MTQVATPASLLGAADQLELSSNGRQYKMERQGDKFLVRTRSLGGEYGDARQLVLVTGSHTLQIPWLETGEAALSNNFRLLTSLPKKCGRR